MPLTIRSHITTPVIFSVDNRDYPVPPGSTNLFEVPDEQTGVYEASIRNNAGQQTWRGYLPVGDKPVLLLPTSPTPVIDGQTFPSLTSQVERYGSSSTGSSWWVWLLVSVGLIGAIALFVWYATSVPTVKPALRSTAARGLYGSPATTMRRSTRGGTKWMANSPGTMLDMTDQYI